MNKTCHEASKPASLEWLVFCYLEDELGRVEREAFEKRLEEDQEAREALAAGVEMLVALRSPALADAARNVLASPCPVRVASRARWTSVMSRLMAVSAAALLAVCAAGLPMLVPSATPSSQPLMADANPRAVANPQLVDAWLQTRSALSAPISDSDVVMDPLDTSGNLPDDIAMEVTDITAPSWMMLAVTDLQRSGRLPLQSDLENEANNEDHP